MVVRTILMFLVAGMATATWIATCGLMHYQDLKRRIEPLSPRHFARFTLVTVGTGESFEDPKRLGPVTAIGLGDRVELVDAGRAVAEALRNARIPVAQPNTVYLTDLRPENTVGLDDLALTGWLEGRKHPLRVVGPPGTRTLARALDEAHAAAVKALGHQLGLPLAGARLDAVEVPNGWTESQGDLQVRAAALDKGPLPALAYRFEDAGRSAVVGDAAFGRAALVHLAHGANVLLQEALHVPSVQMAIQAGTPHPDRLRRSEAIHVATTQVGALAQQAGVHVLVLVRLRPPPLYDSQYESLVGKTFSGRVIIASDGDEITP